MLELVRRAWDLLSNRGEEHMPSWASDERAFEDHFGFSYDDYAKIVENLDQAHSKLYDETFKVNPEAAVIWAIHLGFGG